MIVCHCMNITDNDIRSAVDWMRHSDPATIITPGKVYRALGKRADCGGCMPLLLDTMRRCDSFEVPSNLRGLRRVTAKDKGNEGRSEGHRISQRRT
ncbi:(2Fe-2S)-binding protein [Falsirhodobacter xinxiangensis]|uniref:(2Fe-2S)-binding protein n=1 Tax=Falsirhodobacter xinxiangensis TaxID=2530049 RepID=UPI0010A9F1A6|nr:(2Fe-2S)-binding protein [Rhodobacter xinxiangensis]